MINSVQPDIDDYTFFGLLNNDVQNTKSLAYLIALVDSKVVDFKKAKFALVYLFDIEEQIESASELLSRQKGSNFPAGYYPQTPVMVALEWSPISAMLEQNWQPVFLVRETRQRASALGIWEAKAVDSCKSFDECETPKELFWHVLAKVAQKALERNLLISVIAKPGWSYENNIEKLNNLTLAEAEKADRVIWQRTPKRAV